MIRNTQVKELFENLRLRLATMKLDPNDRAMEAELTRLNIRTYNMYRAVKCPCGDPTCEDWHVWPVAAVQGVKLTQDQAEAIVALLNRTSFHEVTDG